MTEKQLKNDKHVLKEKELRKQLFKIVLFCLSLMVIIPVLVYGTVTFVILALLKLFNYI